MARSPLTLAASVTSALPRVGVVGVGILTEGAAGRYDSALAELDDGRRVVVRAPVDAEAAPELAAEARALRALTPGVRGLLPFRAPELLGETALGDARAVVVDFLPGYRVDAAHLPPGRGAASSIGEALAALHALPLSIVRTEGLPFRTPAQVREDVSRLLDRVESTRSAPHRLLERWRRAVQTDELWRFESAVVLGGAGAASFLFEDEDAVPVVTGVLEWHGLSVGDPATDLQWLASAPAAAEDVYLAYVSHSGRAPDALVRERARLYAELEFAKWLVHGAEAGREDIREDAVALLESLAAGVRDDDIVPDAALGVDDAIALLDRVPDAQSTPVDTSMHTDAYDPEELALWLSADEDDIAGDGPGEDADAAPANAPRRQHDDVSTAPVDISMWAQRPQPAAQANGTTGAETGDAQADAERSSDAALRRWLSD
ncbi:MULTISPECIES: aminoglycoside phosphotransferase [unclassified Microbacterium]|uniref:aminoglycoside phosphotransferase n=1 Tax=unclassified Microbacterium TaxID=2609290 RepID=UPI00214B0CC5|nr:MULTISPECIES: aminoglycoside phosphotransferase [unclassified Microbacterium]MCR2809788.1 aminoglycoside phosphotransferase [Microbacterium sp. zg.B185]WIM17901.1 aminoglycoside phosphotransferase [Microbacterium sp. zg-B185]